MPNTPDLEELWRAETEGDGDPRPEAPSFDLSAWDACFDRGINAFARVVEVDSLQQWMDLSG